MWRREMRFRSGLGEKVLERGRFWKKVELSSRLRICWLVGELRDGKDLLAAELMVRERLHDSREGVMV